MPTYTINGQVINYEEQGPANGPIAILIHGWSSSTFTWAPVLPSLSKRYRCIAVDLPGFGKSPAPKEPPTIAGYADLLAALIESIADQPVLLLGHSMGGQISATLALRQRRRAAVAIDGILANPQLLGNGPAGPSLLVEGPDLLMERQPLRLALVGQLLGYARRGGGRHRDGDLTVGPRHRRLMEGLIDSLEGMALGIKHLVEGLGEVLQQMKAIGDLDRGGRSQPRPIRIGSRPIPGDHLDSRMGV